MIIGIDASRANQAERTGTELYAAELVTRLPALLPDHTIRLYVREALMTDLQSGSPNVEVRILRWPPGILWSHLRLSWEMLWHRPDVLFVPANTVCLIHPRRTVTTIHDVAFERFPELYRGKSVQRRLGWLRPLVHLLVRLVTFGRYSASERDYHRWSSRQAVASSPMILTVSEFSRREITETLHVPTQRIHVTYLGVRQPEVFAKVSASERQATLHRLGIASPYFLFVGRLETKKNIDGLMAAYQLYRQSADQPIDLVLAGQPGFGWDEVRSRFAEMLKQDFIHQLGWTLTEDMTVLQAAAAALICVSRYEGFGIPPLESMSAGVPVIASRSGSLPEILGSSAMYVEAEDPAGIAAAMSKILNDQGERERMVQAGRQHARDFTWDQTAQATAAVLRQAAALPS